MRFAIKLGPAETGEGRINVYTARARWSGCGRRNLARNSGLDLAPDQGRRGPRPASIAPAAFARMAGPNGHPSG